MLVADTDAGVVVPDPSRPIAPRALVRILRDVNARDVVANAPAGLTLADLDADFSTTLAPDIALALSRAVVEQVRRRWHLVSRVKPFTEMPPALALSDLDLSVRAFNAISRFPRAWLREATVTDLLAVPGFGAGVLTEVLAAYEAAIEAAGITLSNEPVLAEPDPVPIQPQIPHRVLEMRELYNTGASLAEVAERFGLTRERVRQLFGAHHLPTRSTAETAALRRKLLMNDHRQQIFDLIDAGVAPRDIAERLAIPPQLVREALHDDPSRRRLAAFRRTTKKRPKQRYTSDELIECLRTASVELGGVLTTADYTGLARTRAFPDGRPWPTHQTPVLRFGSWRAALQRAGLEANPPSAIAGQRLFTTELCVDAILEVERDLGYPPTAAAYERAAAASNGVLPSLATVRHRCGSWQEALVLAARFIQ
jgi:hypothetical protein